VQGNGGHHSKLPCHTYFRHTRFSPPFFMQQGEPVLPATVAPLVGEIQSSAWTTLHFQSSTPPFVSLTQVPQSATAGTCTKYGASKRLTRQKLAGAYQINRLYQQNIPGPGGNRRIAEFGEPYDPRRYRSVRGLCGHLNAHIQTSMLMVTCQQDRARRSCDGRRNSRQPWHLKHKFSSTRPASIRLRSPRRWWMS